MIPEQQQATPMQEIQWHTDRNGVICHMSTGQSKPSVGGNEQEEISLKPVPHCCRVSALSYKDWRLLPNSQLNNYLRAFACSILKEMWNESLIYYSEGWDRCSLGP